MVTAYRMIHSHWIQSDPEGTGWSFFWNQIWTWLKNLIVFKHLFLSNYFFDQEFILAQKLFGNLKCNWTNNLLSHKFCFTKKNSWTQYFLGTQLFLGIQFFPKFCYQHFLWPISFFETNILFWITNVFDQTFVFWPKRFWNLNIFLTQILYGYN